MISFQRYGLCCAFSLLLTGCPSGGSGGITAPPVTPPTAAAGAVVIPTVETVAPVFPVVSAFPPVFATPDGVVECSAEDIKLRVDFDMRDYYIYYDAVPNLNLAAFDSPENLIRDLRVDPDIYSRVTDAADENALVQSGQSGGFGFVFSPAADGTVRFREVLGGSPADQAGILRGDQVLVFDDIDIAVLTNDDINVALDPDNAPVSMIVQTGDDAPRAVLVGFEDFRWITAGPFNRYTDTNGELPVVGYLAIRRFLGTTEAEINAALAGLAAAGGFDELIVDLRYNPGGLVRVARHIASVVGGAAVENQVFLRNVWNDKYAANNTTEFFDAAEEPLNMPRVFVLATGRSSSSSEIFINTLKPYIDVVVIGGATDGKPFTSSAREYCGKAIHAMRTLRTNAVGVSVAGGIQPDCPIADSFLTVADSLEDPLVGGALDFVINGTCPALIAASPQLVRTAAEQDLSFEPPEPFVSEE